MPFNAMLLHIHLKCKTLDSFLQQTSKSITNELNIFFKTDTALLHDQLVKP